MNLPIFKKPVAEQVVIVAAVVSAIAVTWLFDLVLSAKGQATSYFAQ